MKLARRKSVRVLGVVLAVLLLAAVGVKIFLPAEKIRDLALEQARIQLGREVSVGEVGVSLRGGIGVRLVDFAIHDPDGFGGGHLLSAGSLDLKLEIKPLLKGEVRVNRLVLEDPVVNLVRRADGSDNFTFAPAAVEGEQAPDAAANAAAPPPLSVASLTLRGGQITFSDATAAEDGLRELQLTGLALGLSLADPAPGRFQAAGRLAADRIVVTGPAAVPPLKAAVDFDLTWDTTTSRLDIARAVMELNELSLACSGHLVMAGEAPSGQLQVQATDLSLAELATFLPPEQAAKIRGGQDQGKVSASLDLTLAENQVSRVKGTCQADGVLLAEPNLPELNAAVDFDVTWDAPASQLNITSVAVKVNGLPLAASGRVTMVGDSPTGQVRVQLKDLALVDLAAFMPAEMSARISGDRDSGQMNATVDLTLTGDAAVPVHSKGEVVVRNVDLSMAQPFLPPEQKGSVAGRGDLELTFADRTGDPTRMTYAGIFKVRGVSFTESGLVDELQNLDARLKFTQDKFTVENCEAKFASGTFVLTGSLRDPFPYFLPPELQGDAEMKTPHLSFDLRSPRLDVDRLLPAASPTGAAPGRPAGDRSKRVPTDMEFPDLSCDGTFSADSLIYMQVPLTAVTGKVKLRDRIFSVYDVQGAVYHGRVEGQVDVDLNDLNDPAYSGKYQARDIEVDNFVTRFAGMAGVVFGGCNMNGSFSARGLDPETIQNSLTLASDAGIKQGKVVTTGNVHSALNKLAGQVGQSLNQEQVLRDLTTRISVENGRVALSAFTTSMGQFGDVTVDGSYGFNGDLDYTGRILLTEAETSRLFAGGGLLGELGKLLGSQRPARLELPLSVGGTRAAPKMKLDMATVTNDLQKRVVKEQGRKLEDEAKSKLGDLLKKWK